MFVNFKEHGHHLMNIIRCIYITKFLKHVGMIMKALGRF